MKLLLSFFLLISFSCFSQETDKRGTIRIEKASCTKVKDNDSVYAFVDVMPVFSGGIDSLNKWMNKNLRYPKDAADLDWFGTIFCSFIIQSDGSITDITSMKSTNASCENEAKRLIGSMPKWIPGMCNGTIVPVKVNYPIKFILK